MEFRKSFSSLLQSEAKLKVIEFLLSHEASMSEREIASILGISHMSVNRIMKELAEMNLVHYAVVGKAHLWKVNRKSFLYETYVLILEYLKNLPDPLSKLKNVIMKNIPKDLVVRVVLFGSIARGGGKTNSDIDLFILVKNIGDQKKLEEAIEKLANDCLDIFGNRLAPYVLTERQYKEKQGLDIISAVNNGIQLYGSAPLTTGPNKKVRQ